MTASREQFSKIGFGAAIALSILRDGKEIELKGNTIDQIEGRYYVQEKTINPMQVRNGVVLFDLRTPTDAPIVLGSDTFHPSSNPTGKTFTGTGFAIAEGGYVLTCQHVVEKCDDIQIRDATGTTHKARVVASDAGNDLCLLRAPDLNVQPIPAAPPNSVTVGENIYLLGFPMEGVLENQTPVAGSGVVASLKGLKGDPRHYQVTLPINPGNSGGPVLDSNGRWIAVASHKLNDLYSLSASESIPQGVNFAVKGTLFIPLLDSIPDVKLPLKCALIFGAVDHDGPRLVLSELSAAYRIALIDVATEIFPGAEGRPFDFGGRIVVARPGDYCLFCADQLDREVAKEELETPEVRSNRRKHGYGLGNDLPAPSVFALNGILANAAVMEFIAMTTGIREPARHLTYKGLRGVVTSRDGKRMPDCYMCECLCGQRNAANVWRYLLPEEAKSLAA